jgi:hypothetical protein
MKQLTQTSHGQRYPMAPRSDELLTGVQAPELAEAGTERTTLGRFASGASTAQRKGGLALKHQTALSHRTGLAAIVALPAFKPYLRQAKAFARAQVNALARSVGGGECGPGAASVVTTASLQLAASRFCFDQAALTGDADLFLKASKLGDASRNNLLSASDLCATEANGRPDPQQAALLAAQREFQANLAKRQAESKALLAVPEAAE